MVSEDRQGWPSRVGDLAVGSSGKLFHRTLKIQVSKTPECLGRCRAQLSLRSSNERNLFTIASSGTWSQRIQGPKRREEKHRMGVALGPSPFALPIMTGIPGKHQEHLEVCGSDGTELAV